MDAARNPIIEALKPMSSTEARQAIATGKVYVGMIDSPNYKLAFSLIEAKEAEERNARDSESLSISRKALQISEKANDIALKARSDAKWANIIAISAIVLSIATAIGIAILQFLTKK